MGSTVAAELADFLTPALARFRVQWGDDHTSFEARLAWQRILAGDGWVAPAWSVADGGRGLGAADRIACEDVLAARRGPMIAGPLAGENDGPTHSGRGTARPKTRLPRHLPGS